MKKIVLASASPRRAEILRNLNITFDILPSDFFEDMDIHENPNQVALEIAYGKAKEVATKLSDNAIVIAADTVVYCDGEIMGKPTNDEIAFNMLTKLSNNVHQVITGLCVIDKTDNTVIRDFEVTNVHFNILTPDEIKNYISTKEPIDKAGAYGIQGFGGCFVKKIDGCYFNVVGLPVSKLYNILKGMGINLL